MIGMVLLFEILRLINGYKFIFVMPHTKITARMPLIKYTIGVKTKQFPDTIKFKPKNQLYLFRSNFQNLKFLQ
jgi:hypothetical protein